MRTKLGLLTSKKTAILHATSTKDTQIAQYLDRYSKQDLFEMLLMIEYLQLKTKRHMNPNEGWLKRLKQHERVLHLRLPGSEIEKWMHKLELKTSFDANRHARNLLFIWFRE